VGLPFWSVPDHLRTAFFTGRDDVIAEIRKRFTRGGRADRAQAISGLGGIGKTQTAAEYAYRYRDEYQAVLWLDADSPLALKTGCGELARRLHLPYPENDLDQAVVALKQWLATQPGWLLIFDNADDPDVVKPFLPGTEHGHILITSRAQDFEDLGIIKPVQLEQWPVEDAAAFLLKRCGREDADAKERGAAAQIAHELDGLPLALEQAAAYISTGHGLPFRRYLESYRSEGLKRLEARRPALGDHPRSVVSTWAANFDAVQKESPAAADVLRLSAFLAPDAVPFELLTEGASEVGPEVGAALNQADDAPLVVDDLLKRLDRFSLIRIDGQAQTYSIHRLVQEVLKAAMDDTTRRLWAERAVRAINRTFPSPDGHLLPLCGQLLPHALAVAHWIKPDHIQSDEARSLLRNAGWYLAEQAQFAEAETLFREVLKIADSVFGLDHPEKATSLNELATQLQSQGKLREAEQLSRKALEIRQRANGPDGMDMARSLNNLGYILLLQGGTKLPEAESLFRQSLGILEQAPVPNENELGRTRNNLAEVLQAEGKLADAERFYKQAIEAVSNPDKRSRDLGRFLSNLAGLYKAQGQHIEAAPLYRQAVAILRGVQGTSHPYYREVLNNYLINQREGGLAVPEGELLAEGPGGLPAPPSEPGQGDADSNASGA
jgi:tetratricopeptide (TPR) repeat protein